MALFPEEASVELELPAGAVLARWRAALPYVPLALTIVAAFAVYWPSLNSAFVSDDYVYLYSVKHLSFARYAHVSIIPRTSDAALFLPHDFWRPFYFLSFEPMARVFGDHPLPYHLVNMAIHVASLLLVWRIAQRLTGRMAAANIAAVVFAVHPAGIESISWISSVNSAGLPFALGAWLGFLNATEAGRDAGHVRWWLAVSVVLLAVGSLFRETALVVLPAMALCYLLVEERRSTLLRWRAYLALAPFVALVVVYSLARTRLLTAPAGNSATWDFGEIPSQTWYYVKLGLSPFRDSEVGWHVAVSRGAGVVLLAAIPLAVFLRRWLLVALLVGFVCSCLPYSAASVGVASRYFYFPSAFLAMALGVAGVGLFDAIRARSANFAFGAAATCLLAALIGGGYAANERVAHWVRDAPDVSDAWVTQLRTDYPTLPAGGTLYTTNTPLALALFDSYDLPPTVQYYYPQVQTVIRLDAGHLPVLQLSLLPNDRVFVYEADAGR